MTIKTIKEDGIEFFKVYHVRVKADGKTRNYLTFLDQQKAEDCAGLQRQRADFETAWIMEEVIFV